MSCLVEEEILWVLVWGISTMFELRPARAMSHAVHTSLTFIYCRRHILHFHLHYSLVSNSVRSSRRYLFTS